MGLLRIIFMGTPELAAVSLAALLREPTFQVVAVVTQPDRPKGRELKLQPSPVKRIALDADIPVLQPIKARDEDFIAGLQTMQPDLIAVAAYGQILPKNLLDLPRFGCLNVHTSLLPKYRGAAPIQWALLNDEMETGVTIMKMDAGLDTGEIVSQRVTPIHPTDNAQTLHDRLAQLGAELLVETIPDYVTGSIQPRPQPAEGVSYAAKIKKEHGRIDWHLPSRTIWNRVRAFTPWPSAFTFLPPASSVNFIWLLSAPIFSIPFIVTPLSKNTGSLLPLPKGSRSFKYSTNSIDMSSCPHSASIKMSAGLPISLSL